MRMRIVGSSCAAVVLACAVASAGQITSQPPSHSPVGATTPDAAPRASDSAPSPRTTTDQAVTIVGCIARAHGTDATTKGSGFIIENAVASSENPHPSATGTTGSGSADAARTTPAAPTTGSTTAGIAGATPEAAKSFALTGPKADDLSSYVGQRVQVVGRVKGGAIGSDSTAGVSGDAATPAEHAPLAKVTVTSVRAIAGACS